jgi:hypothetical protein
MIHLQIIFKWKILPLTRLIALLVTLGALGAQSRIDGRIVDKETGIPLIGVNIFFSKTSIGTTTDKNGFYTINNISQGRYELVVSMIGYELERQDMIIFSDEKFSMDFRLTPEPINMKEIMVTAKSNKQWKKDYEIFKAAFLGNSRNGVSCTIINEYVLSFKDVGKDFIASSSRPLEIENRRLGYMVKYYLEEFTLDNKYVRYAGDSFFTELKPRTKREKKKWDKNRQIAYKGSLRHFLATLGNRFDRRYRVETDSLIEKDDWLSISGTKRDPLVKEGFEVYLIKDQKSGKLNTHFRVLGSDSLVSLASVESELMLSFKKRMKVRYRKESEEMNYGLDNWSTPTYQQTSYIILDKDSVIIDKNGRYFEVYMIEQQGYMGWERVGDQLPFNYGPPKD